MLFKSEFTKCVTLEGTFLISELSFFFKFKNQSECFSEGKMTLQY